MSSRNEQDDCEVALNNKLQSLGFANVAWENSRFADPNAQWVRPTFMPAPTQDLTTKKEAGGQWLVGVYQVDVFSPLNGGDGVSRDAVAIIEAGFAKGTMLTANGTTVRIGRSYRAQGRRDPVLPYFHIPVRIEFYANF